MLQVMITQPGCTVNFMCQLDWAKKYPAIWFSIILGISMKVFLDVGNRGPLYLTAWIEKRSEGEFTLLAWWSLTRTWVLFFLQNRKSYWNLYHQLSWFLGLWIQTETIRSALVLLGSMDFSRTIPLAFVSLQLTDLRTSQPS